MSQKSRSDYLAKNVVIFTIGNIGTKLITFFMVPLYTAVLVTSEYGTIDLITTISKIIAPLFTLNICESVLRFALDKDADHSKITRVGMSVFVLGSVFALVIIPICSFFDQVSEYSFLTYLYIVTSALSQLFLCDLRGKELLTFYSVGSILNTFFVAVFNIIFLVFLKIGISGYFLGYILANTCTAIYAITVGKGYRIFKPGKIDIKLLKEMIKYSIVLVPNSFMWWIMNSSDRIMVTGMVGADANGVYAVSYKIPSLVTTLTAIFNQAWSYSAIKEENSNDESKYNNKIFKTLTSAVMMIGIIVIIFAKQLLKVYVSRSYYMAWKYIPFLVVGCVYLTLGTFMATSYTVHKDSFGYLISGSFGAILNIALNFALIPAIDVYGAALATGVSYVAVFVFRLFHTRKYISYDIKNKEFVYGTIAIFWASGVIFCNGILSQVIQIAIVVITIIFYSSTWGPILVWVGKKIKSLRSKG